MAEIDWDKDNINYSEILKGMLSGVEEYEYRYNESVEANELESVLFDMINRVSITKPALLNVIALDRMGIVGNKLVKLWHLCEENQEYFEKTVGYMTGTTLSRCFTKDEVIANMNLDEPIEFIPNDPIIPNFQELHSFNPDKYDEIIYALRKNFVRRYNERVSSANVVLPMPEEPKDDILLDKKTRVNPARLYFGIVTRDLSGGVLGINMQTYGLFECSPNIMKIGDKIYYPLRDLEDGSLVMVDEAGKKLDFNEEIDFDGEFILPTKQVVSLEVGPLKHIIKDAIEHGVENEVIGKYKDMLINGANVEECDELLKDLASVYQFLYGGLIREKGL